MLVLQPARVRLPLPAAARARHLADAPLREARPAGARTRDDGAETPMPAIGY